MTGHGPVVIRGDARALPLPDESVNLVCTSPPYWGLRSYQDAATATDYLDALVAMHARVLPRAGAHSPRSGSGGIQGRIVGERPLSKRVGG